MKMNKSTRIISTLAVSSIFILSGCSTSKDTTLETISSTQEITSETTSQESEDSQSVANSMDTESTQLNDDEKTLSLEGYGAKGALADTNLTLNDMLMYAVQDEYLAHGEYVAIVDKFGSQNPYANISSSEEMHLSYLEELYHAHGLDFPADESADHIVVPDNLLEAAKVGVQAEIDKIAMSELFLTYDLPEDVRELFSALKSGSKNHLASFQKQVDKLS